MTRHGGQKTLKRLNAPKHLQIKRKHGTFLVNPTPGPHPRDFSLPLLHVVRDLMDIAHDAREAKKLIGSGFFKVDGRIVREKAFPLGLMDVLSIDKMNKHYRILPDPHYGLILHEIDEAESMFKLCRLDHKRTVKEGNIQLNLHDGRNVLVKVKDPKNPKEANKYKRMDVLKISIPEQDILDVITLKEGTMALIMDGKNIGQLGKISKISKRFGPNASTVTIEHDDVHTETLYDYTFVIGSKEPEISIPDTTKKYEIIK